MEIVERGPTSKSFELEFECKKNAGYKLDLDGCNTRVLLYEEDIFGMITFDTNYSDSNMVYKHAYICPVCGKVVFVPENHLPEVVRLRIYRSYLKEDYSSSWQERKNIIADIYKRNELERRKLLANVVNG